MGKIARRSFLTSAPVAAFLAGHVSLPDPVFSAIARHKAAFAVFVDTVSPDDRALGGEKLTDADFDAYDAIKAKEYDALEELFSLPPTTIAGMRTVIEYFVHMDRDCMPDNSGRYVETLLKSPLLAA